MRCGNCQGNHDTSAETRACYGINSRAKPEGGPMWPASDAQVKYALDLQRDRAKPDVWVDYPEAQLRSMERDEVSAIINMLKGFSHLNQGGGVVAEHRPGHDIPDGRYALQAGGVWRFYRITKGTRRWEGYTFIKQLIGAPGAYRERQMSAGERAEAFKAIGADPKQAMIDYGLQSKSCGQCGSPLSNAESLAIGIGPDCRAKLGW